MTAPKNMPSWIKTKSYNKQKYLETKKLIEKNNLNTVCIGANCPNRYECFSKKTATFMILGNTCTRNCKYCNIKTGKPNEINKHEPKKIAEAIKKLNLKYAVITCVTRDDLRDGGAQQFTDVVKEIKKINPDCKIELLISDLQGDFDALKKITNAKPDVINHNIEVPRELFTTLRPQGNYNTSLNLLKKIKEINPNIKTKSGFMIGLGEDNNQITTTLQDLKKTNCDIITIGQYLQPSKKHYEVKKYYSPEEFKQIKKTAKELGIQKIIAGPLVRSSYKAKESI